MGYVILVVFVLICMIIVFLVQNFWIVIVAVTIIAIAIIAVVISSKHNHNPSENNSVTPHSPVNTNNYLPSPSKTYRERPKVHYNKIEDAPNDYIVFDLETTGLDYAENDILEIGAIKYNNGTEVERFHTYIKINKVIPPHITRINGITNDTIKDAPLIRKALTDFLSFIGNYPLIAYNSDFDMSFMQYSCQKKLNTTISNGVIDALPLAREYLSELPNKKLETIKRYFGLSVSSHNALDDCFVTNHLYQYCRQYEELKYKYIIQFSYSPSELNEKEVLFLEEIVKICEENGISRTKLSMSRNRQYLTIGSKYQIIARLKLYSKLQYVLLNIPYSEFIRNCSTSIKHTPAQQSESEFTRIFPETPEQLWQFKEYIPTRKVRLQIMSNTN